MAVSNVAIANGALQKLGARRIESLTQDAPNARSMNAVFERVRASLLRRYDWSFAIKRASIAADSTQTTWGELNRFSLPNDYIRLLRDNETQQKLDWKIEGRYIVTNDAAPLEIRYLADITDPTLFDALFVEAFEWRLAYVTCKEITGSDAAKSDVAGSFQEVIDDAKLYGAIEKGAIESDDDPWWNARY